MGLIRTSIRYHLDAHRANLPNLLAGMLGMTINNLLYLAGFWAMLFAGKARNEELFPYFAGVYSIVTLSWGALNFFIGGWRELGTYITEGTLETMLATPRPPLLLAAIGRSSPGALGDLVTGLIGTAFLAVRYDPGMALRCLAAAVISAAGFAGLYILAGSLAFFVSRGQNLAQLAIETTLTLSLNPTGKLFTGMGRVILLMTPAAATGVLPVEAVLDATASSFAIATGAALGLLGLSVAVFNLGLKRFRSLSVVGPR